VIPKAIGLDDQPELRPMEIDAETLHSLLGFRLGQSRPPNESQEPPFELRVRQGERASIKDPPQRLDTCHAAVIRHLVTKCLGVDQSQLVGSIHSRLERTRLENAG
jgi:hypothetical protein